MKNQVNISPPKVTNKASVTDPEEIKTVKKQIQNNPLKEVHQTIRMHKEKIRKQCMNKEIEAIENKQKKQKSYR